MDARAKVATLQHIFFPESQPANLTDTHNYNYPELIKDIPTIAAAELKEAVFNPALDKVPGSDGISHHILWLLYEDTAGYLHNLFNVCLQQGHHSHYFRVATMIALHKPAKPDYKEPKAWHPIASLNTLGKVLEAIIAWKIHHITEHYNLLLQA